MGVPQVVGADIGQAASLDLMDQENALKVMKGLQKPTTIFYSTHILDDVQRLSDTVAILN